MTVATFSLERKTLVHRYLEELNALQHHQEEIHGGSLRGHDHPIIPDQAKGDSVHGPHYVHHHHHHHHDDDDEPMESQHSLVHERSHGGTPKESHASHVHVHYEMHREHSLVRPNISLVHQSSHGHDGSHDHHHHHHHHHHKLTWGETFITKRFLLRNVDIERYEAKQQSAYFEKFAESNADFFANPEMPDPVHFLTASPDRPGTPTDDSSYTSTSSAKSLDDNSSLHSLGSENLMSDIAMSDRHSKLDEDIEKNASSEDDDDVYAFHPILGLAEPPEAHLSATAPAGFWRGALSSTGSVHSKKSNKSDGSSLLLEQSEQYWRAMSGF